MIRTVRQGSPTDGEFFGSSKTIRNDFGEFSFRIRFVLVSQKSHERRNGFAVNRGLIWNATLIRFIANGRERDETV